MADKTQEVYSAGRSAAFAQAITDGPAGSIDEAEVPRNPAGFREQGPLGETFKTAH